MIRFTPPLAHAFWVDHHYVKGIFIDFEYRKTEKNVLFRIIKIIF